MVLNPFGENRVTAERRATYRRSIGSRASLAFPMSWLKPTRPTYSASKSPGRKVSNRSRALLRCEHWVERSSIGPRRPPNPKRRSPFATTRSPRQRAFRPCRGSTPMESWLRRSQLSGASKGLASCQAKSSARWLPSRTMSAASSTSRRASARQRSATWADEPAKSSQSFGGAQAGGCDRHIVGEVQAAEAIKLAGPWSLDRAPGLRTSTSL